MQISGRPRRVFLSYAQESANHIAQVRELWLLLRQCGVEAVLDIPAAQRRVDWALWMADQVREADYVLVIASEAYRKRAEGRAAPEEGRGVQWEARLIRDSFYENQRGLEKYVPVVLPEQSVAGVPDFLAPATTTVYHVRDFTIAGAETLLRMVLDQPAEVNPPLGDAPVLGVREHTPMPRITRVPASGWVRESVVRQVHEALDAGHRAVLLHGLPRTGKTTVARDALAGRHGTVVIGSVVPEDVGTPLVVLDGIESGASAEALVAAGVLVVATSRTRLDDDVWTCSITVPPLDDAEIRDFLAHFGHTANVPPDLPALSLPGALRAVARELRRSPTWLITDSPLPDAVREEMEPLAALVDEVDRAELAWLDALGEHRPETLRDAGLLDLAALANTLPALTARGLVTHSLGVPAVVASTLERSAERRRAVANVITTAREKSARSPLAPALVEILPGLARAWLAKGLFPAADSPEREHLDELMSRLNREGHWPEYIAMLEVLIDAQDLAGDRDGAAMTRCRLARKLAQRDDRQAAGKLLREAEKLLGGQQHSTAWAVLCTHRAYLAYLNHDNTYAVEQVRTAVKLFKTWTNEPYLFIAHKLEGDIHLQTADHRRARRCYTTALRYRWYAEPTYGIAAEISLAVCDRLLGRTTRAVERLDALIGRMRMGVALTELPRALHVRALLAEDAGQPTVALRYAQEAFELEPRDFAVRDAIAGLLWRLERFTPAGTRSGNSTEKHLSEQATSMLTDADVPLYLRSYFAYIAPARLSDTTVEKVVRYLAHSRQRPPDEDAVSDPEGSRPGAVMIIGWQADGGDVDDLKRFLAMAEHRVRERRDGPIARRDFDKYWLASGHDFTELGLYFRAVDNEIPDWLPT